MKKNDIQNDFSIFSKEPIELKKEPRNLKRKKEAMFY